MDENNSSFSTSSMYAVNPISKSSSSLNVKSFGNSIVGESLTGSTTTDTATVSITINPVNDAPVASNDNYNTELCNDEVGIIISNGAYLNDDLLHPSQYLVSIFFFL